MDRLLAGQAALTAELAATEEAAAAAAEAILTTDLVSKQYALETQIGDRMVRLGGMAKGSGMIHPDMATMLAFITCDAGVDPQWWQRTLQAAVDGSFNAVTVDGDTSTNDTVLAFAAGAPLATEHLPQLALGLECLCCDRARAIARDGEGATCLLEVTVSGTATAAEARTMARTICGSSLVKTAIHGRDPNWGRVAMAVGKCYEDDILAERITIRFGEAEVYPAPITPRVLEELERYLASPEVLIHVNLGVPGDGPHSLETGSFTVYGCDLTDGYVRINADYTT